MNIIKRAFSRREPTSPQIYVRQPDRQYIDMLDGTRILHYQVINVNEILPDGHARIFDDWAKNPLGISFENQYCQLELACFITLPHQKFKPSQEIYDTICRPFPEVKTKDQIADLMKLWFGIFNTWFFANTLSKTKLVVDNFETTTDDAFYDPIENFIVIIPDGFEHCKGDYEGTLASYAVDSMCVDGWQPSRRHLDDWGVRTDIYGPPKDWDSEQMEVLSQDQILRNQSKLVLKNTVAN